jgi:RND superfamily putative drug exporter
MAMGVLQRLVGLPAGRRGKRLVLAAWLLVFGLFGGLAGFVGSVEDNNETNWMPASAGSTRAAELAQSEFPADNSVSMVAIFARERGLTDQDRAAVDRDRAELAALGDGPVSAPTESADRQAVTLTVPVAAARLNSGEVNQVVARARAVIDDGLPEGLVAKVTGPAALRADAAKANGQVDGALTLAAVGVVAVLLLLIYRSPVLPVVALGCVAAGVTVAQGGTYLAERAGAVVSGSSFVLMIVLVFGLGTDYALLLISRYREELHRRSDQHEAMALALQRTTPAVLASAGTMVLAALALLAADMNSTRGLGPVAAVAVASALLAMTTLLPALLVVLGRWVFWPRAPRSTAGDAAEPGGQRGWAVVANVVSRRPRQIWVATTLVLAAAAAGVSLLHVGGLADADNFTHKPDSVVGQELIAAHFPAGSTAPVLIYTSRGFSGAAADAARSIAGVASVQAPEPSESGQWVRIPVVLNDPPTSASAQDTIDRLRARLSAEDSKTVIGGEAATLLDQNRAMNRDLTVIVPIIIAVVVLVLGLLLRAILAPLLLLGCTLLSAGAALGLSTLLFDALGFGSTDQSVLTLGFLFLVALGVDYTIFLMARAREEVSARGHQLGLLHALTATGGVITSAGVVLAASFLVLTITPVVLNIQLGLLVALGVLIDAFIVRAGLLPAAAIDVGRRIWWPGRLSRVSEGHPGRRTPPTGHDPAPATSPSHGSGEYGPWQG